MIKANDPSIKSWLTIAPDSDFSIQNLPFGIFKAGNDAPKVGVALGDKVIDLAALNSIGYLNALGIAQEVFENGYLNDLMALGKSKTRELRNRISDLFNAENNELQGNADHQSQVLKDQSAVAMLMPVKVGDYTDFYSSKDHATNVGTMFRDPNNALLPNWLHIPVGYHGRASSIIVSGTPIHRPKGQMLPKDADQPIYGPCKLLDFELEMAFVTCKETALGDTIPVEKADEYIWGMVLFNDWSARDIQKWEYVPLGPFLGKNFGSSISPWVVTLDALQPFKTKGYDQEPKPLPYLQMQGDANFDVNLEVYIQPENAERHKVCTSNYKYMYWNMNQQLAHHAVNGCNINVGDMYASGTISGPEPSSYGSMLELSWRGTKPIQMPDGSERKFINDNDSVIMKGYAEKDGVRVGFGEVSTKVLPAK